MPTIDIRVRDDDTLITVDAIATPTPGLVATRSAFRPPHHRWWSVTHVESGAHLPVYFEARAEAVAFAGDLRDLADWTRPAEDLRPLVSRGPARDAALRAVERHGGAFGHELD